MGTRRGSDIGRMESEGQGTPLTLPRVPLTTPAGFEISDAPRRRSVGRCHLRAHGVAAMAPPSQITVFWPHCLSRGYPDDVLLIYRETVTTRVEAENAVADMSRVVLLSMKSLQYQSLALPLPVWWRYASMRKGIRSRTKGQQNEALPPWMPSSVALREDRCLGLVWSFLSG